MSPQSVQVRHELGRAFAAHKPKLAQILFEALRSPECQAGVLPDRLEDLDDWGRGHFGIAVDLARAWLSGKDARAEDMLLGWVCNQLRQPAGLVAGMQYQPAALLGFAAAGWTEALSTNLSAEALAELQREMERMAERIAAPVRRTLKALFIGDCLISDVITALAGPCARAGIRFSAVHLHTHVPALLRREISELAETDFDLAFFGPFSHVFTPDYQALLQPRSALWPRARFFNHLDQTLEDTERTVRTLVRVLKCPIYVHNSAGTIPLPHRRLRTYLKYALVAKNRRDACSMIRRRVSGWCGEPEFQGQVRLLDEEALAEDHSRIALGSIWFESEGLYHPSRLGLELARGPYLKAMATAALLNTKKVVVCDLDNTLWDGVIGEGAVRHHLDRQTILRELRQRGVLLSINSKNDPANVHFTGAALQYEDFVAPRINWEAKTRNMAAIADALNLKTKDFVFIDDREDELERVRNAFPEMVTLNACHPSSWDWLSHWKDHLRGDELEDRTRLYHERAAREQFLSEQRKSEAEPEDEAAALASLGLSVRIEMVGRQGMKRAAELINRTNQFNLCGSRTTASELLEGLGKDHWVLSAEVSDKFGSMGVVGVMRVDARPESLEIPIFVLSCRVFGMGIEYSLLNSVRQLAPGHFGLVGHYRETAHNRPGRHLYEKSGLRWVNSAWEGRLESLPPDPAWLNVERRFSRNPEAALETAGSRTS